MATILDIENGKLVAYTGRDSETMQPVNNLKDLQRICTSKKYQPVLRSSSLDFPKDYTSDPVVLALVGFLNQ